MLNLNGKKLRFVIDLDETLCSFTNGFYEEALPWENNIKIVNNLYEQGHYIIIFTARGTKTKKDWSDITKKQLAMWGVKYHELKFGKPYADFYIDDKNLTLNQFEELFK